MNNKQLNIKFIQDRACERVTEVFDALGMEYTERHDYIQAQCPVHDGDNPRGIFWAIQSNHWQCKTHGCHRDPITGPSTSIFGLVRGTLSRKTNKECSFIAAVRFVAKTLGLEDDEGNTSTAEDIEIAKIIKQYRKKRTVDPDNRQQLATIVGQLRPDQVYYPNRGVPPEIIAKYHISFCDKKSKPMYQRAFFPVLDITGRYVVGWSGRSIYEKCKKCNMYHHPRRSECPDEQYRGMYTKWKHSKGFKGESSLYNSWYAKPFISKSGTAIICEGPGDVWALEIAGIKNSVAIMGTSMSKQQRLILQNSGALTVVLLFDNDSAGLAAMGKIEQDLMYYFRVFCLTPETVNDVGDMLSEDILEKLQPIVSKASHSKILSTEHGVDIK